MVNSYWVTVGVYREGVGNSGELMALQQLAGFPATAEDRRASRRGETQMMYDEHRAVPVAELLEE